MTLRPRLSVHVPVVFGTLALLLSDQLLARKNRLAIYRELPDVIWWDGEYWSTGNLRPPYPDY
jgi:hypothetical protein